MARRVGQRGFRRSSQRLTKSIQRGRFFRDSQVRGWNTPVYLRDETPGIYRQNTLEGGTATTAVTTGNSGGASGNAFNAVFSPAGCTQTYESDGAGGLLLRMVNTASDGGSFGWDLDHKARFAARTRITPVSGTWTGDVYLADIRTSTGIGGSNAGISIRLNASQQLRIMNRNGFVYPFVGTYALVVGTSYQLEVYGDLVAGTAGVKLWSEDGTTLHDSGEVSGQDFRTAALNQFRFMTIGTAITTTSEFDDIAFSLDDTPIGPIVTSSGTNAPAENTTATGTAYDATILIVENAPTEATGTGAANDAAAKVTPNATEATGTGTANDATVSTAGNTTATPAEGAGTGTAYDATVRIVSNATGALASGIADDGDVASSSIVTGSGAGNTASPSVTLSASITPGQNVLVMLMQNNTDVITAVPSELTSLDPITPSTGTGATNLYWMVADATTPGSTLTWTLSATRNWAIAYIAISDVEQDTLAAVNALESAADTVTATTSFTAPSATSSAEGYVIEFFGAKADGVALTDLGKPSGYTERVQRLASTGTFGSNISIATRDGNPSAGGTYGGDTWTTDSAVTTTFRYTLVLRRAEGTTAAVGDALALDATVAVVAKPSEAAASGDPQWTPGDVVDLLLIADNPIYATGTAYDATVSTAVVTTATPTSADATGASNDATSRVDAKPAEAAATGTSVDPAEIVAPTTGATATGTAHDAAPAIIVNATEGTATGVANQPIASTSQTGLPTEAAGTGTAYDAATTSSGTAAATQAAATGSAPDPTTRVAPNALEAVGAATGHDATTTSSGTATATEGAATGTAYDAAVSTSGNTVAPAAEGSATGTAYDAATTSSGTATAGSADVTGAAVDAAAALAAAPVSSDAAGAAGVPGASVAPTTGASGSAAANDTTAAIVVAPDEAAATGTAPDPTTSGSSAAPAAEATGSGSAHNATTTSSGTALPGAAAASGTAHDAGATNSGTAFPDEAPATGEALDAAVAASGTTSAAEAAATGSAYDATTTSSGAATASEGASTGAAYDATISVVVNASPATTTGTSGGDIPGVAPTTTAGAVSTAYDATIRVTVGATEATATGSAGNGIITSESQAVGSPPSTTCTGAAYDATVRLTAYPVTAFSGGSAGGGYLNLQVLVGRSRAKGGHGRSKAGGGHGRSRAGGGYGQSDASGGRGVSRARGGDTRT